MLYQIQGPSQRPQTTAHLAQTMSLLELTSEELSQRVEAELSTNPALETIDISHCPICNRPTLEKGPCPVCRKPHSVEENEPIVFISPRQDFYQRSYGGSNEADIPYEELTAESEDLPTYVLRQIAPDLEIQDRPLAAHILTCLDDDGLLSVPVLEIARYHHVPISKVERVLAIIQRADPIGVASPNPKEALLVQLDVLAEMRPVPDLAEKAIREGMALLSRRSFSELAHLLGTSKRDAERVASFISENLNPFPARTHWGRISHRDHNPQVFHHADIIISTLRDEPDTPLVVEIISPYAGMLRVNTMFKQALVEAPPEKLEQWHQDIENASLLVKCIQQRDNTIVRLMQRLVVIQKDFIFNGDVSIVPITRAQLADELKVHESTVSRAVSSKAVQLPSKKIVPLARFFDRSLHIRAALLKIIEAEKEPLSDAKLASLLAKQGYPVARRTVAKYRSIEGILPARLRHKKNNNFHNIDNE